MPSLILNKILGGLRFAGAGIGLPGPGYEQVWNEYAKHAKPEDRIAVPKLIPQWIQPKMQLKAHQLMADSIGQSFKDFHDTMCDAIAFAHNMWRLQAQFGPMPIVGPIVAGAPSCLVGPPLLPSIMQYPACVIMDGYEAEYRDAVAKGTSQAFMMWQTNLTVPGLPFYPAYVMAPPGPAVPMPNVPFPLMACVSANVSDIMSPPILSGYMMQAMRPDLQRGMFPQAIFDAIATTVCLAFTTWLSSQMVLNVLGAGAVASPTGGPVAGMTLPTPGHLAT